MQRAILILLSFTLCTAISAEIPLLPDSKVIIMLGPPGSGKGTQSEKLSNHYGTPHISTGDLVRDGLKHSCYLGSHEKDFKKKMAKGELLPDDMVLDILINRLEQEDCRSGFVLDGYPRSPKQWSDLQKQLPQGQKIQAISLTASNELIKTRIEGRLSCPKCHAIYHRKFKPPKWCGICNKCRCTLYQRPDDHVGALKKRLEKHQRNTEPLIAMLKDEHALIEVDTENNEAQDIFNNLITTIERQEKYPRDYVTKQLRHYPFKGVNRFYNLVDTYLDPDLNTHIIDALKEKVVALNPDYIASPEARSLPYFGALTYELKKPGIFIRKSGKIPGPTRRVDYATSYSSGSLEMARHRTYSGQSVVIIDDGISSGGTLLATIELLEKAGLRVVGILAVVNHSYDERDPDFKKWEPITFTLFDL